MRTDNFGVVTDLDRRALAALAPHARNIAGCAPRQSAVPFVECTWRRWLVEAGWTRDSVAELFELIPGQTVDRRDLAAIAGQLDGDEGRLLLLTATLVWGRGKKNARMKAGIQRVLAAQHPTRSAILHETQRLGSNGQLADAYRAWTLDGLRQAFFTKWLWASTLADPAAGLRPLVLDSRVWQSLNKLLGWSSLEATSGDRAWAVRYEAYVRAAHRWARELRQSGWPVSAEDIECALFVLDGDRSRWAALP